jgi:hypothetical protein
MTHMRTKINEFFNFTIMDDHVNTAQDNIYFVRYYPKNLSIMNEDELNGEISVTHDFLKAVDIPFEIFITDKFENLEDIKKFYTDLSQNLTQYDFIHNEILSQMEDFEKTAAAIQRAFYITVQIKERSVFDNFYALFKESFNCELSCRNELMLLMRNWVAHEYTNFDFYYLEREVAVEYEILKEKIAGRKSNKK